MKDALSAVALAPDQERALLGRSGLMGAAWSCVLALESGDEKAAQFGTLEIAQINGCYFSAVDWVERLGARSSGEEKRPSGEQAPRRRSLTIDKCVSMT